MGIFDHFYVKFDYGCLSYMLYFFHKGKTNLIYLPVHTCSMGIGIHDTKWQVGTYMEHHNYFKIKTLKDLFH